MRLGVGRLLLAIASVTLRIAGDPVTADVLAIAFLTSATVHLYRAGELRTAVRPVRS
jgi:hypothetical protein